MDEKLRETTNLFVEIMNSKRQVKGKLGHAIQIRVCRLTSLSLSTDSAGVQIFRLRHAQNQSKIICSVDFFRWQRTTVY